MPRTRMRNGSDDHGWTGDEAVSMNMWGFTPAHLRSIARSISGNFLKLNGADAKSECYIPTRRERTGSGRGSTGQSFAL